MLWCHKKSQVAFDTEWLVWLCQGVCWFCSPWVCVCVYGGAPLANWFVPYANFAVFDDAFQISLSALLSGLSSAFLLVSASEGSCVLRSPRKRFLGGLLTIVYNKRGVFPNLSTRQAKTGTEKGGGGRCTNAFGRRHC